MLNKSRKPKHFMSCFICGVDIDDYKIVLEDSSHHNQYIIDRSIASIDTLENFKLWFSDVYMKCVPATATIVDYDIVEKDNGECLLLVNKLVSPLMGANAKEENKENG